MQISFLYVLFIILFSRTFFHIFSSTSAKVREVATLHLMLLCQEIANFTPAESDILARGVCCRRMNLAEVILKEKFIKGGVENGFDKETLETFWSDWMKYACY